MKLFRLFFLVLFLTFPSRALAQEEVITRFTSSITLNQNTSATITETIDYFTPVSKHGIYRYIPLKYAQDGRIFTNTVTNIKVTNGGDSKYPFTKTRQNHNLVLKIGDPDTTFKGKRTYVITYTVSDALNQLDTHDEFYWDITGEGWQIPILQSSALIDSRFASPDKSMCYSGEFGTTDGLCTVSQTGAGILVEYEQPITFNQNLTVTVAYDRPNSFMFPTPTQRLLKTITDNLVFFLILAPLIILFALWYQKGRDYRFISSNVFDHDPIKPIRQRSLLEQWMTPFVYEPLKDLTPGEAGAILDERVDNQDIVAEIIELARLKYLKIEPKVKNSSKNQDFTFHKLKAADTHLKAHQSYLLNSLFGSANQKRLSTLKGKFSDKIVHTKMLIDQSLTGANLYTRQPNVSRGIGIGLALIINFIVAKLVFPQAVFVGALWPYPLFFLQAGLSLYLGYHFVQKTAVGTNYHLQAKGLRRTIKDGKWREVIKEKNLFIEEILPFAIAFGVVNQLTRDMKVLNLKPPAYASSFSSSVSPGHLAAALNSFSATTASSLSYHPKSSSSSGGSGFSGGSSGGGRGGGGGGSW